MPSTRNVYQFVVNAASSGMLLARVYGGNFALIQQADFGTITSNIRRRDKTSAVTTTSLTVATVVYDTLQTSGWTVDSTGWNFRWDFTTSTFATPGDYGVTIRFAPSSGQAYDGIDTVFHVERAQGR